MEPDDSTLVSCRGHLFGLINISNTDNSANIQGRQVINQINESYYSSVDKGIIPQLRDTLANLSQLPDSLSLILVVVAGNQLHLAVLNSGQCILQRGNQISSLLTCQAGTVVTISGEIVDTDRLLLCTDGFYQNFSWENIKLYLSDQNIDSIEENFLSRLYSFDHQAQLAGVLVEIHEDSEEHSESAEELPPPRPEPEKESLPSKSPKSFFSIFHRSHSSYIAHLDSSSVTRRKKINILFALAILITLFISIFLGYRRNLSQAEEFQYQALKSQLEAKITAAQTVKSLSLNDALVQSQDALNILQKMSLYQKTHTDEISKFQQTVATLLSQTGSAESFTPELFFDTGLINNNLPYSKLSLSGNSLYLLDALGGHIDKLDIANKSHQNISTSDDIKNTQSLGESNGILYLLRNTQIFSVLSNVVTPKINLLDQIKDFTTGEIHFWNGSLYILSVGSSTPSIWKYAPNVSGFVTGENWLKNKQSLPSNPSSFAINGSVWVISQKGVIAPYSLGVKQDYKQTSLVTLTGVSNLVTSIDSNLLAFSDNNNQIYTYNKIGQSISQYNFGNRKILSLVYSQTNNIIFVLCEDRKIYKISL
jgi:hypothetical protein